MIYMAEIWRCSIFLASILLISLVFPINEALPKIAIYADFISGIHEAVSDEQYRCFVPEKTARRPALAITPHSHSGRHSCHPRLELNFF